MSAPQPDAAVSKPAETQTRVDSPTSSAPAEEAASHPEPTSSSPASATAGTQAEEEEEAQQQREEDTKVDAASSDDWQAVFSAEANAWYFWNAKTNETTWSNPRQSTSAQAGPSAPTEAEPSDARAVETPTEGGLPPIDPDLAWLDPAAARRNAGQVTQTARFNARTGRFQADPAMNPDRISDFKRGQRQQEAFYDVQGWENSLAGKGLKRGNEEEAEGGKKRPSTKQVQQFKQAKEEKKRRKVSSWLAS